MDASQLLSQPAEAGPSGVANATQVDEDRALDWSEDEAFSDDEDAEMMCDVSAEAEASEQMMRMDVIEPDGFDEVRGLLELMC